MRAFRFARLYLSALEATGLVVITASDYLLDSRKIIHHRGHRGTQGSLLSFF